MDPLALLARDDKWFLGGGKGALYAPPFPKHLLFPGFWDECYLADIRLNHIFTALFIDAAGKPLRFRSETKGWRPDRLLLEHRADGYLLKETRTVLENQSWVSEFELLEGDPILLVSWSLQEVRPPSSGTPWQSVTSCESSRGVMQFCLETAWPADIQADRTAVESESITTRSAEMLASLPIFITIGADRPRQSYTINLAQRHDDAPIPETSLIPEKLRNGSLPGDEKVFVGPGAPEGLLHILQQYSLGRGERIQVVASAALSPERARQAFEEACGGRAYEKSERSWRDYFASVPQFSSSDPWLTNAYWYRWYGLRLNTVDIPDLPICGRSGKSFSTYVTEGIGFFRNFVTYSAQAHVREVAWMHDPGLALSILENLGKVQRDDGSFPGHNYSCRPARDFYHADFASGYRLLKALHGEEVGLETLRKYGDYLRKDRTTTSQMIGVLVLDQNETGQEYMSRYQEATEVADQWGGISIVGAEATFYAYLLAQLLLEDCDDEALEDWIVWLRHGLIHEDGFFPDQLPTHLSHARPAVGLFPLAGAQSLMSPGEARESMYRWLFNPGEFWLPAGFPATTASDQTFSAEGEWKGQRLNCPWNGRSWPMANSHLCDSAAAVARWLGDPGLRQLAGEALMKTVKLMFHDGDAGRPNSYEHYDPATGIPALYRGYDDYMHSWIADLILRHAVGVQPGSDDVDPLPLGAEWIECRDIPHPRGRMHVRIERDRPVRVEIT